MSLPSRLVPNLQPGLKDKSSSTQGPQEILGKGEDSDCDIDNF